MCLALEIEKLLINWLIKYYWYRNNKYEYMRHTALEISLCRRAIIAYLCAHARPQFLTQELLNLLEVPE